MRAIESHWGVSMSNSSRALLNVILVSLSAFFYSYFFKYMTSSLDGMDTTSAVCKICLEKDDISALISPCKCSGSM